MEDERHTPLLHCLNKKERQNGSNSETNQGNLQLQCCRTQSLDVSTFAVPLTGSGKDHAATCSSVRQSGTDTPLHPIPSSATACPRHRLACRCRCCCFHPREPCVSSPAADRLATTASRPPLPRRAAVQDGQPREGILGARRSLSLSEDFLLALETRKAEITPQTDVGLLDLDLHWVKRWRISAGSEIENYNRRSRLEHNRSRFGIGFRLRSRSAWIDSPCPLHHTTRAHSQPAETTKALPPRCCDVCGRLETKAVEESTRSDSQSLDLQPHLEFVSTASLPTSKWSALLACPCKGDDYTSTTKDAQPRGTQTSNYCSTPRLLWSLSNRRSSSNAQTGRKQQRTEALRQPSPPQIPDTVTDFTERSSYGAVDVTAADEPSKVTTLPISVVTAASSRQTGAAYISQHRSVERAKDAKSNNRQGTIMDCVTSSPSFSSTSSCSGYSVERSPRVRHGQSESSSSVPCIKHRSSLFGSYWSKMVLVLTALVLLVSPSLASMDIWAYEYQRKFNQQMELGQCPMKEARYDVGNQTILQTIPCDLFLEGSVRPFQREHRYVRNVRIHNHTDITSYLGLCGGEAASFLGILNSGDCVGLEIASSLSFSARTMVRAYVSHYQQSMDIMDKDPNTSMDIKDMFKKHDALKNKYYLKSRSYGTQEIVFVQFRFKERSDARKAREIEIASPKMTDYMTEIRTKVGKPKTVLVISISTSKPKSYQKVKFEPLKKEEGWERAFRHVDILERTINYTNERIQKGIEKPHLKYHFFPFLTEDRAESRLIKNPLEWERISMVEIQLRDIIALAKKTLRKCRKIRPKLYVCKSVREHRRLMVNLSKRIHEKRAAWISLKPADRTALERRFTNEVSTEARVMKKLIKEFRAKRREVKQRRMHIKQKQRNQIPLTVDTRFEHSHRIRAKSRRWRHRAQQRKQKLKVKYHIRKNRRHRRRRTRG